jgi:hypothetical protein
LSGAQFQPSGNGDGELRRVAEALREALHDYLCVPSYYPMMLLGYGIAYLNPIEALCWPRYLCDVQGQAPPITGGHYSFYAITWYSACAIDTEVAVTKQPSFELFRL